MKRALVGLGLLAAGCSGYTAGEVRSEPARFTVTVPAPLERMVTCIKAAVIDEYSVVDLPKPSEHRTELVLHAGGYTSVTSEVYDLQAVAAGTAVTWRRQKMLMRQDVREERTREIVDRCGKAT